MKQNYNTNPPSLQAIKPAARVSLGCVNHPEFEGCIHIGQLAASIAKEFIMRGYEHGVYDLQETMDLIAILGLKNA